MARKRVRISPAEETVIEEKAEKSMTTRRVSARRDKVKAEEKEEEEEGVKDQVIKPSTDDNIKTTNESAEQDHIQSGGKRKRKASPDAEVLTKLEDAAITPPPLNKSRRNKKQKLESPPRDLESTKTATIDKDDNLQPPESANPPAKRARKTKAEKEAETMPLATRTLSHAYNIGAHVSSSGGVHNSITNAVHIGANSFALFLKSQRKWSNPPLDSKTTELFISSCSTHNYLQDKIVVPHGSYLVNLAHLDPDRTKQAYDCFVDDLKRCESLGIKLYNFHPGNVQGQGATRVECIKHLAENINKAHRETSQVVTLLENMAAKGGNIIGTTFEDLRDVIELTDDKSRVGVCLDTCHAFAAGYDLRDKEKLDETMNELDKVVGLKYLKAVHLNDSKAPFDSRKDLHANIGTGFLGLRAFHAIMNDTRFHGLPIVLETPIDVYDEQGNAVKDEKGKENKQDKSIWAREIKMLESLTGMDIKSEEFKTLEVDLAAKGQKERDRIQDQVSRRDAKAKVKAEKEANGHSKRKKKGNNNDNDSDDNGSQSDI